VSFTTKRTNVPRFPPFGFRILVDAAPASTESKAPSAVLTAVFFVHLSVVAGAMIKAWLDSGHRISAVVVYRQKKLRIVSAPIQWIALQWSLLRHLRRHRIPIIDPEPPLDWQELRRTLAAGAPDVAITYGFMRLVPQSLIGLFPRGALNFHPALLPYYRGPQPFHWIAIDNAWKYAGGVTLHEMTDAFDEGPIVAQAAMSDASVAGELRGFVADALATMTRDVIPRYCAGEIRAWPQPPGDYPYANHGPLPELVVKPHWTRQYLQLLCSAILRRPGVSIEMSGGEIRLLTEAGVLGPPSGKPPVRRWHKIEFDLADHRVVYWRHTQLNKLVGSLRALPRQLRRRNRDIPVRLGPFGEPHADQAEGEISAEIT
jgi:methionyl-tRNA formyltransferase